jgi:hypothetical protein
VVAPDDLKNAAIGRHRANETRRAKAASRTADLAPVIATMREEGVTTATVIAKALGDSGIPTSRGRRWRAIQVQRPFDANIIEIHADGTTLPTPISGQLSLLPAGSGIAWL